MTPEQERKVKKAIITFLDTSRLVQANPPQNFGPTYAKGWDQGIDTVIQRAPTLEWAILDALQ